VVLVCRWYIVSHDSVVLSDAPGGEQCNANLSVTVRASCMEAPKVFRASCVATISPCKQHDQTEGKVQGTAQLCLFEMSAGCQLVVL
jgi:hypothetical protein